MKAFLFDVFGTLVDWRTSVAREAERLLAPLGCKLDWLTFADAWPDASAGLKRLKQKFLIAPVSNGNISLMVDLARRNGFPWDAVLGAEVAGDYKPKPRVYLAACEAFDLPPGECAMVAAHSSDLAAAASCGLRTAHIARPNEAGPGKGEAAPKTKVDLAASSIEHLAEQLGA